MKLKTIPDEFGPLISQNYLMINLVNYKMIFILGPAANKITSSKVQVRTRT